MLEAAKISAVLPNRFDLINYNYQSDSESSEEEEEEEPKYVEFPELEEEVERAIRELDGAVVPKLNWSSPKVGPPLLSLHSPLCFCPAASQDLSRVRALLNPVHTIDRLHRTPAG